MSLRIDFTFYSFNCIIILGLIGDLYFMIDNRSDERTMEDIIKANTPENLMTKFNTWLTAEQRQEIKEKLFYYFDIEYFKIKPIFSQEAWMRLSNNRTTPSLLIQSDGSCLLLGLFKNRVKKVIQKGVLKSPQLFFSDVLHNDTLGFVIVNVE